MLHANKFVVPDNARTWQYLMGQNTANVQPDDEEQVNNQLQIQDQTDAPVDIFGNEPNNERARKMRSGRAYVTSLLPKSILLKARNPVHFPTETFNPDFDQLRASARATNYARSRGLVNPSVSVLTTTIEDDVPSKPSKHLGIARDLTSSEKEEVPSNKTKSVN
jgi:hypothetical protein